MGKLPRGRAAGLGDAGRGRGPREARRRAYRSEPAALSPHAAGAAPSCAGGARAPPPVVRGAGRGRARRLRAAGGGDGRRACAVGSAAWSAAVREEWCGLEGFVQVLEFQPCRECKGQLGLEQTASSAVRLGLEHSQSHYFTLRSTTSPPSQRRISSESLITESQDQLGWKRPLRSPSPTYALTPPCQLHHGTKCLFQYFPEHLQQW